MYLLHSIALRENGFPGPTLALNGPVVQFLVIKIYFSLPVFSAAEYGSIDLLKPGFGHPDTCQKQPPGFIGQIHLKTQQYNPPPYFT